MKAPIDNFIPSEYPIGCITQLYGENPKEYQKIGLLYHNGIDIVAPHGSPMYAIESGTVVNVEYHPDGFGKHVRIITDGKQGEVCREWTYGHCNAITVEVGDKVKEGDLIATMGNTGFVASDSHAGTFWGTMPKGTKGTHLHLGLRLVRRDKKGWAYKGSTIKIEVCNYQNGVKGAVDPMPYIKNLRSTPITKDETKNIIQSGIKSLLQKIKNK